MFKYSVKQINQILKNEQIREKQTISELKNSSKINLKHKKDLTNHLFQIRTNIQKLKLILIHINKEMTNLNSNILKRRNK